MKNRFRKKASALVTTLFVVVVLSTIVMAFMASMSLERKISKSLSNRYQAELAAEAGLNIFMSSLPQAVSTNVGYFIISTNVSPTLSPIPLLAAEFPPASSNSLPLVSGPISNFLASRGTNTNALANFLATASDTNSTNAADLNKTNGLYRVINNTNTARFNAPWIFFTNSTGSTNRVAFFVVDEQSKLNLALHGTSTNTNRAGWSSDPLKVPISVLGISNLPLQSTASNFANNTNKTIFSNNLGNLFSNRSDYEASKHLLTYFSGSNGEFIPPGYTNTNGTFAKYTNANFPKFNINDRATNTNFGSTPAFRASNIANIINSNLPSFRTRDVSMSNSVGQNGDPFRYLHRIASSIVDYIDSDSVSTTLEDGSPEGEPAGKELAPLITTVAEKYNWVAESGSGANWTNSIRHTVFVQLWNPYQTNISGNMSFNLISVRPVRMPGAVLTDMVAVQGSTNVTIRPNEHIVVRTGIATNLVRSTIQASLNVTNHPKMDQTSSTNITLPRHTQFKAYWNGATLDRTPYETKFFTNNIVGPTAPVAPGLSKDSVGNSTATRITLNGVNRFSINYPSYGAYIAGKGYRGASDPRQNFLTAYVWETLAQDNTDVRWNGRNNNTSGTTRQDYNTLWSARDFVRTNPLVGNSVNLDSNDPTNATSPYNQSLHASNAPFFIRNGPMQGIAELGNIYDPACLNDVGFAAQGGNPDSWYVAGGARTLRIGIPEFQYPNTSVTPTTSSERLAPTWSAPGMRSSHLLDLFTTAQTNSLGFPEVPARININTAPREVLAAVLSGLSQNADQAFTNSRIAPAAALSIADAIIQSRPYLNKADFQKFSGTLLNPTNFIPTLGANSSTNIAALNDPGREQIFAGILDLFDTNSQTFRVFSIGQTLGTKGQILSEAIIESLIRFDVINVGGQLRLSPVILSRRSL